MAKHSFTRYESRAPLPLKRRSIWTALIVWVAPQLFSSGIRMIFQIQCVSEWVKGPEPNQTLRDPWSQTKPQRDTPNPVHSNPGRHDRTKTRPEWNLGLDPPLEPFCVCGGGGGEGEGGYLPCASRHLAFLCHHSHAVPCLPPWTILELSLSCCCQLAEISATGPKQRTNKIILEELNFWRINGKNGPNFEKKCFLYVRVFFSCTGSSTHCYTQFDAKLVF